MNQTIYSIVLVVALVVLACLMAGCARPSILPESAPMSGGVGEESAGDNVFYATVTEISSAFGGVLVEPESDSLPNELVIHSSDMPVLSVGDRVRVQHNGQITLSLPGQIFGATVSVVK